MKRITLLGIILGVFVLVTNAQAVQLNGLMTVDAKQMKLKCIVDENGDPIIDPDTGECVSWPVFDHGSYFAMGADNPMSGVSQEGGAAGGITLGTHQPFILDPDEPNPPRGTGYARNPAQKSDALKTFQFFGVNTYIGLNPVSYQSGQAHPAPSATVDSQGNLSVDLSCWEVMWNGSAFEQGPRPDNKGPFILATGTYDYDTGDYVLGWKSQIKGGPFGGVSGFWHLEGTILADPVAADVLAEPRALNVKSQGNGFTVRIELHDTDGSLIPVASIEDGVMISSVGSVDIDDGMVTENLAGRAIEDLADPANQAKTPNGIDELKVTFDDPATGNRQDVIAAVSDLPDGSLVDICVKGMARDADNIRRPFEACSAITIRNKGNR